jgi:hypothetical protein
MAADDATTKLRWPATFVVAVSLLGGCTAHAPLPSGAIRVPTDDALVSFESQGILCGISSGRDTPPTGVLDGDASDQAWPVWLLAEDGSRRYVLWPRDFSVRFDPDPTLLDETGKPVLYAGSPATIAYPPTDPTSGTKDRPYVAESFETGLIHLAHCYTRDH